jgi:regulatory protein
MHMKITDIKQQIKQQSRYSVFVSGKYAFSLSDSQIRLSCLKIGQELTKEDVERWKRESDEGKVLDRTLRWLAIRPRSEWELNDYLKRKDVHEDLAHKVIEQIREFGYIDDKEFADSWVRSRRMLKSSSKRRLCQELQQKRIASDIIDEVLTNDEIEDSTTLDELIEKKSKQTRYQDDEKLIAYLARQGFNYSDIKEALSRRGSSASS